MENHHSCIIGKSSIHGPFSMAMLKKNPAGNPPEERWFSIGPVHFGGPVLGGIWISCCGDGIHLNVYGYWIWVKIGYIYIFPEN